MSPIGYVTLGSHFFLNRSNKVVSNSGFGLCLESKRKVKSETCYISKKLIIMKLRREQTYSPPTSFKFHKMTMSNSMRF